MAALQRRHNKWRAKVRVPKQLRVEYGKEFEEKTLIALDRPTAKLEAAAWELGLRAGWAAKIGGGEPARAVLRQLYEQLRAEAEAGAFVLEGDPDAFDEITAGIGYELEKYEERHGQQELSETELVRVLALQDAIAHREGRKVPRREELEPTFRELADDYLTLWRTQGLRETNTEQQKVATFDLFAGYWGSRPIREVRKRDAAEFVDALRQMDPSWARSPKARSLGWTQLQEAFGGKPHGLSDGTINRHMATLKSVWAWAQERDHCEGNNPFGGFHKRLKGGRNVKGYQPWEPEELRQLFNPPPKRGDLTEVMLVAMHTGMRLDEIASLTRGQIKIESGVWYADVVDAKTEAGVRRVPLHPRIHWLIARADGDATARIWPKFNPEGPGKKAGADAGKEFSRFKLAKGFSSRRKAFHSFRKNFVGQLEEAGVPQNEVAQLVGHEKGFTYRVYGGGVSLQRLAEVVALIDYPGLNLPEPGEA